MMTKLLHCEFRARRATDSIRLHDWLVHQEKDTVAALPKWPVRGASWCAWLDGEPQLHVSVANVQVFWNRQPQSITCIGRLLPTCSSPAMLASLVKTVLYHLDRSSPQPCICFFPLPSASDLQFVPASRMRRRLDRSEWGRLPSATDCVEIHQITPAVRRAAEDLYLHAAVAWDGALCRDATYWRLWSDGEKQGPGEVVLVEPGDQGYGRLRATSNGSALEVLEIAATNPWHDLVVLSGIISLARQREVEWIELELPPAHALWEALTNLGCRLQVASADASGQLAPLIRPPLGQPELFPGKLHRFTWNAADSLA